MKKTGLVTKKDISNMKLKDLKQIIDRTIEQRGGDLDVKIPNNKSGMGFTSSTNVKAASRGIDWDHNTFFIVPEVKMTEINTEKNDKN